jgi:magnesium and cobalt exporter, CNNM family
MTGLTLVLSLLFILTAALLSAANTALQRIGKLSASEELKKLARPFFIQRYFNFFLGEKKWEGMLFCLSFTKQILQIGYAGSALVFFLAHESFRHYALISHAEGVFFNPLWIFIVVAILILFSLLVDFAMNILATLSPKRFFETTSSLTAFLLFIFSPLSFLFLKILRSVLKRVQRKRSFLGSTRLRDKILELLHDSEVATSLEPYDKKLILSVASFKDRVVREVMIPRVDIQSLPAKTSVYEATKTFDSTGYSRIPVYKGKVDNVIGVLLYKDLLKIYATRADEPNFQDVLSHSIEKWIKPILYAPETKKISHLLQEFRTKQIHLALVVNEYGKAEGIVTIEDILEELVGEIADEHDIREKALFSTEGAGEWILDAKMSIIDIEKELEISIPHSPEYDTIGGYVFHKAGNIPSKGWVLHYDAFDLEVLSSNERTIEKIKITILGGH